MMDLEVRHANRELYKTLPLIPLLSFAVNTLTANLSLALCIAKFDETHGRSEPCMLPAVQDSGKETATLSLVICSARLWRNGHESPLGSLMAGEDLHRHILSMSRICNAQQ